MFILLAVTALIQTTLLAQNEDIVIDEDVGETLELKAINVLAPPIKPRVRGALTIGAGADCQGILNNNAGYAKATRESLLVGLDVPLAKQTAISGSFERAASSQLSDGIFLDRRIPLITGITYQLWRGTFIKVSAATPVYRRYKFCTDDGTTVESLDSNFFPSFNLSAGAAF